MSLTWLSRIGPLSQVDSELSEKRKAEKLVDAIIEAAFEKQKLLEAQAAKAAEEAAAAAAAAAKEKEKSGWIRIFLQVRASASCTLMRLVMFGSP